jgi:hypothetical protein
MPESTIGIIAGQGQFPLLFARAAKKKGLRVVAVAHKGETLVELADEVDEITWVRLGQLGKLIKALKSSGTTRAVMCGGVKKTRMFKDVRPDFKAMTLLNKLRHMADDGILRTFCKVLEDEGILVLPSHELVPELLATAGVYTKREPSPEEQEDLLVGWQLAGELGSLDIGQCVVVHQKVTVAVEAVEGTDACIKRAGELTQKQGCVVVKRLKPIQDKRFDLPSVGSATIETMKQAGATCLVIEPGSTLVFDREEMVKIADNAGICVLAHS